MLAAPAPRATAAPPGDAPDLAEAARRAGALCAQGDADAAADALRQLLEGVEAQLGEAHPTARIVRLSLAHAERARGNAEAAALLEVLPEPTGPGAPPAAPAELERALKRLRPCAALRPAPRGETAPLPEPASGSQADLAAHLRAARTLLDKGQVREAAIPAEIAHRLAADASPQEALEASELLALVRIELGDAAGAAAVAREAEAAARKLGAVGTRIRMARLLAQAGELEGARASLAELAPLARTPEDRGDLEEARGDLALRLGAPGEAREHLERALALHRAHFGDDHPSTAAVWNLLGDACRQQGDFPAATDALGEALRIRQQRLGKSHPETARTQNALGVLYADFGDWRSADEAFAAALRSLNQALGPEHRETVTVEANRALAAWSAGKSEEAARAYAAAVESLARAYGAGHPVVAEAQRTLARIEQERGRPERAAVLLEQALAAQTRALGPRHPAVARTRLARGQVLAERGALEAAEGEISEAVAILVRATGDEHPAVARARIALARVDVALGRKDDAFREAVEAGRVLALHLRRAFDAMPDRQRALLAADTADVVGALLSAGGPARETWAALVPHRDAVLRSIAESRAAARARSPQTRAVLSDLAALRERYVAEVLSASEGSGARARRLARKIDALEAVAALAGGRPLARDPQELLHAACARLPGDAALVELVGYDESAEGATATRAAYAAFVLRKGAQAECGVERIALGPAAPVDRAAEAFARGMRAQKPDDPDARAQLSRLLIAPLSEALRGADRWLLSPDGPLWGVPFAALPDPRQPDRDLVERVTLATVTSVHELAEAEPLPRDGVFQHALLFGAPSFGEAPADGGPVVLTAGGPCRIPPFEPLPGTQREIQEIGALLEGARVVTGADATVERFREELARGPALVHLATHAYFAGASGCRGAAGVGPEWRDGGPVAANPLLLSGIVFAGANAPARVGEAQAGGGILTAYEAAGLDLGAARLVVLSACDTGTGLQERGQEVQGLRWGFRASGARALVTSLWRSNDVATRRLMHDFYQSLAAGDLPADLFGGAEALRRAQLARVADDRRLGVRRPLTWANFVFSGVY